MRDAELGMADLEPQDRRGDPGAPLQEARKVRLAPEDTPVPRDEEEEPRSDKLLERPPAPKPHALGQRSRVRDVAQVPVADVREGVVAEHGVDRLRELRAARLVDAAGVDPHPAVAVALCEPAARAELGADEVARVRAGAFGADARELADVLEGLLWGAVGGLGVPYVRDGCVAGWDLLGGGEEVELCTIGAEEPHEEAYGSVSQTVAWNGIRRRTYLG